MSPLVWVVGVAAVIAVSVWIYAAREEQVGGRTGPAVLRGVALVLIVGSLDAPPFRGAGERPSWAVLVDGSRSMELPARSGGPARWDSALTVLAELDPDLVYVFGDNPTAFGDTEPPPPGHALSRLGPALEAVSLGGLDSVWVLTDGALTDRAAALSTARRLGIGLREIRTAAPSTTAGIRSVRAPELVRAADTVSVTVELAAGGAETLSDSLRLVLTVDGRAVGEASALPPAPGRTAGVAMQFSPEDLGTEVAADFSDTGGLRGWLQYRVDLIEPAGALAPPASSATGWIEVSDEGGGAVYVASDPSWEGGLITRELDRLALGGAEGFLLLGDGRVLRTGPPVSPDDESAAEAALRSGRFTAVRIDPATAPDWLVSGLENKHRTLTLLAGHGRVPGTEIRATAALPGEWYITGPPPPGPVAPLAVGLEFGSLPPVGQLFGLEGLEEAGWRTVLEARRDRRGGSQPLIAVYESGVNRHAVVAGTDLWRFALRGENAGRIYDAMLSGVVGWLLEDYAPRPVRLAEVPDNSRPPAWLVAEGVSDLSITVNSAGRADEVWRAELADPPGTLTGPVLPPGSYRIMTSGNGPDGPFSLERPLDVAEDRSEWIPGAVPDPTVVEAAPDPALRDRPALSRPVWPFPVAAALLCAEWAWRRRIGLR